LELVTGIAQVKNEITDSSTKHQLHLARQKRLELEQAKVNEEKSNIADTLKDITQELETLNTVFGEASSNITNLKSEAEREQAALVKINMDIEDLERRRLTLESHREFIEKLQTKLEDISESIDAVIYLDKLPQERVNGLVIKIKDYVNLTDADKTHLVSANLKLSGEAKPIDLDTQKINQAIAKIQEDWGSLKNTHTAKAARLEELNQMIAQSQQELHSQEINLANKKSAHQTVSEQFNKINEEQGLVALELSDVDGELSGLDEKLVVLRQSLEQWEARHKQTEQGIHNEEGSISSNSGLKEKILVEITQLKTELEALAKRVNSEEATLEMFENAYRQDKDNLANIEKQILDSEEKKNALILEIKELGDKINQAIQLAGNKKELLKEKENACQQIVEDTGGVTASIESDRRKMEALKNNLYELQMRNKDVDYKILSLKERMQQSYKVDLETVENVTVESEEQVILEQIEQLKGKLDSLGTVNLVAIEEYDELKKRYDFLIQQQTDLTSAKESLHEAILKINRTTKNMFLETFEQVRQEFRNYFRLLFNGGDAQIFLIDEEDPLESGIEIICRPPGKKLQNVLLLSGGEKAMSATALIFAIFKVKPAPFCVLDEIDAALDEANVNRFSRLLQEFAQGSQFIVITHNKRTIANADVMYGITMAESGVSKIVSVKFAQGKVLKDKEPDVAVAEPV